MRCCRIGVKPLVVHTIRVTDRGSLRSQRWDQVLNIDIHPMRTGESRPDTNKSLSHLNPSWKDQVQKGNAKGRPGQIRYWAGVAHWRRIAAASRRESSSGRSSTH